jgi:hypothetical protein
MEARSGWHLNPGKELTSGSRFYKEEGKDEDSKQKEIRCHPSG